MSPSELGPARETPYRIVFSHESERAPEAAVIVPVWNGARFLKDCCDSVRRQQSAAIELIIIDDDSTDESGSLACDLVARDREFLARALVVRHDTRAGPAAARDTGMRVSKAPAALLLDVDNIIYPRCVRRCLDALEASSAAFVYPTLRFMGFRSGLLGYQQFDRERLSRGNYIDTLAMLRRSAWQDVGGFPDLLDGFEDYSFWLRLIEHGYEGAQIPEILGAYRKHMAGRTEMMVLSGTRNAIHKRLERAFPWIRLGEDPES